MGNRPDRFTRIESPKGSMLSGACVCAMATGKSLGQILDKYDWRRLMLWTGQAACLADHDITVGDVHEIPLGELTLSRDEMLKAFGAQPALVSFKSAIFAGVNAISFWTGRELFDPSWVQQDSYTVKDLRYVYYVKDTDASLAVMKLDPDWRKAKPEDLGCQLKGSDTFVSEA